MVGWHHRLHGHEFEQVPGVGNGLPSLGKPGTPALLSPSGSTRRLQDILLGRQRQPQAQGALRAMTLSQGPRSKRRKPGMGRLLPMEVGRPQKSRPPRKPPLSTEVQAEQLAWELAWCMEKAGAGTEDAETHP